MALNQGIVTLNAALTSNGNAETVIAPKLVSPTTTTVGKTTLSALAVGALRQISVAANLIVMSFPGKSAVLAGDRTQVVLPSMAAFPDAWEMQAQDGTSSRREWKHVDSPYAVSGGNGANYVKLTEAQKKAFDALLQPVAGTATLESALALAIGQTPAGMACVCTFDQSNNKLKIGYGTEANLDTYKALVVAIDPAADKEVLGFDFEDIVVIEGTDSGFLE